MPPAKSKSSRGGKKTLNRNITKSKGRPKGKATSSAASSSSADKKTKLSFLDQQFDFPPIKQTWMHESKILGTDFIRKDPLNKFIPEKPTQIDFELEDFDEVWSMGPNTRFHFRLQFQVQDAPTAAIPAPPWRRCPTTEGTDVIVQPNWLEHKISLLELFHGQSKINTSADIRHVTPFLNTCLYNLMDPEQKKMLCVEDCHPGNGVPEKKDDWSFKAGSKWLTDYSPKLFAEKSITFSLSPLHFGPLMQGSNYMEFAPKILPMPLLNKLIVRFIFNENEDAIFKKNDGNAKKYRIYFEEIYMTVERLRLNNTFKTDLLKKNVYDYPGVTRIMKFERINQTDLIHKAKHDGVLLPEGLFIFVLPQNVMTNQYKYSDSDEFGNVFLQHNIKQIEIKYGDLPYFMYSPNLGQITNADIEFKIFNDYFTGAPFGLNTDSDKIKLDMIENGAKESPYPHAFINFCNFKDKSRIVPFQSDGSMLSGPNNMEISLYFNEAGATPNSIYIVVYYYTDKNISFNTSIPNKPFCTSPYIIMV